MNKKYQNSSLNPKIALEFSVVTAAIHLPKAINLGNLSTTLTI
jgi:hypothetical protein